MKYISILLIWGNSCIEAMRTWTRKLVSQDGNETDRWPEWDTDFVELSMGMPAAVKVSTVGRQNERNFG